MIISPSRRFIFIHVVKAGGTSVTNSLRPFLPVAERATTHHKHIWASQLRPLIADYDDYFSFGFVRNPWDRLVSNFFWWQQVDKRGWDTTRYDRLIRGRRFHDYALGGDWLITNNCRDFLYDGDRRLVTEIGRFEHLASDFAKIARRIGLSCELGWSNRSLHHDYRQYYTSETVQLVADRFKADIDLFGYDF